MFFIRMPNERVIDYVMVVLEILSESVVIL